jgi:hypothetical protein
MKFRLTPIAILFSILLLASAAFPQTSASMVGSVKDPSGAVISGAQISVTNTERGITRTTVSNSDGEWGVAALPPGKYDLSVTAAGFKGYQAKGVVLDVAQKARVDVAMQVGATTTEVTVEGTAVAQVETQSSELGGVVSGKEINQLQLNGRNFTQLVTLVPGVSNQTGQDEGAVGVAGNVSYSINGGRTEYNNWELDGGDNMDNGSNTTLNVYPSLDAIAEFKVLTSNYGAQYGRNGSGTVEVETKSGTSSFHGDAYEFVRNDAFNANNYFNAQAGNPVPPYKKNDFGYTIGGPVYIPGLYNTSKQKTFFFWSQEWRRDRVPGQTFNVPVPGPGERQGNFSDLCPAAGSTFQRTDALGNPTPYADCPGIALPGNSTTFTTYPNNTVPFNSADPNVQGLLALIPPANTGNNATGWFYNASPTQPTNWREELFRIDHNITNNVRATFRYIHDSWDTVNPTPLWTNIGSFPTIQTNFKGPGVSLVARLTATISPTLLNEFVASYTADHITLINTGAWQRPAGSSYGTLFPGTTTNIIPGINLTSRVAYGGSIGEDPGYINQGPYNANPTYTYRDNVSKIVGKHNLQFGGYFVAAQKNEYGGELSAGSVPGYIGFNPLLAQTTTGNPFSDLLVGDIYSFGQQDQHVKYYNRYKIFEPYFQDDFHATSRLTLNMGLRVSLFGTYREKYHHAFNFDPTVYQPGVTTLNPDGSVNNLYINGLPNGIVQCGVTKGVPVSCMQGHLFNPAPRLGFAFDPKGDGKMAIRGGYGIFFEHTNGNEANTESLENSPPYANTAQQLNIVGYTNIGKGQASPQSPLNVVTIPTKAIWPYIQQWHFDVQRELPSHIVAQLSYVGSKGTHLTFQSDPNQIAPVPANLNPYKAGEAMGPNDCKNLTTPSGVPITGRALLNFNVACGANPDLFRPYLGYSGITGLRDSASSIYHSFQASARRQFKSLDLQASYTLGHSIDDSSSRQDGNIVNSYDPASNRASSNFDQRQIFSGAWVWDLPFFGQPGLMNKILGGWEYSGIATFSTGSPFTPTFPGDPAGGGSSASTTAYADIIGNPNSPGNGYHTVIPGGGYQLYNPGAFGAPQGLTFGDAGRNSLRNPNRTNFDMALFKHFRVTESVGFEFRAEAFNIFNHTEWGYVSGDGGSSASNSANLNSQTAQFGSSNFLQVLTAHNPRILQLGAKFLF